MSTKGVSLGATKLTILRESCMSQSTWSKLVRSTGVSEKVLSEHLRDLQQKGFLVRSDNGYIATDKGREVLKELIFAEEMRKQRLMHRLLVVQKLVKKSDMLRFESIPVLLKLSQKPLTVTRYEALAVIEALEVRCDRDLHPAATMKAYENALKFLSAGLGQGVKSATLTASLDLAKGFAIAEEQLKADIEAEQDLHKKQKLEIILQQFKEQRESLMEDARKRFLS
jgi:predicted transcriptional regulator